MKTSWNLDLLSLCNPQSSRGVLFGYPPDTLITAVQDRLRTLEARSREDTPLTLVIAEAEPINFLASFLAGLILNTTVVLGNPRWVEAEWQKVLQMLQPDLVLGVYPDLSISPRTSDSPALPDSDQGLILVPTGGSSGNLRFVVHTLQTLSASVQGFQAHFQLTQVNTCCVLPVHHVSGLMQFMRSLLTGGQFLAFPFKDLESGRVPTFDPADFWISLVPTQLQKLFHQERHSWLSQFQGVLMGGAPAWPSLLAEARHAQIPLALTYGMTETAAQVATLHPQDFLQGTENCGRMLPHLQFSFEPGNQTQSLAEERSPAIAKLRIQGASLALGYFTELGFEAFPPVGLLTDDLGYLDAAGYLHVVGRDSCKIITGGENVFPAEVEAAIYDTGLVKEVCVIGVEDQYWGQVVTAIYIPGLENVSVERIQAAIASQMTRYKQPKQWIPVQALPRNAQGKVNLEALKTLAKAIATTTAPPD